MHTELCNTYQSYIEFVRNRLIETGFKVARMYDVSNTTSSSINNDSESNISVMNERYKLIQQSKIILLCLDLDTQNDDNIILELGNNRGFKYPRPVIPLFLEPPQKKGFPDNEMKVHCHLGDSTTKIFDISNYITNTNKSSQSADTNRCSSVLYEDNNKKLSSEQVIDIDIDRIRIQQLQVGIAPLDLELINLIDYIHIRINNIVCIQQYL